MSSKELGRATFSAFRLGGATTTHIFAAGKTPNWNDKVDVEQLPIRIFPPWYGLYFIHQDFQQPAERPFLYHESISYPPEEKIITIVDADGDHKVAILDISFAAERALKPAPRDAQFCVFENINTHALLIAPCDVILPAIFRRVFGPADLAACEKYVKDHGK